VEEEGHVVHNRMIYVGKQLACGVISEFPWAERVEPTDASNQP